MMNVALQGAAMANKGDGGAPLRDGVVVVARVQGLRDETRVFGVVNGARPGRRRGARRAADESNASVFFVDRRADAGGALGCGDARSDERPVTHVFRLLLRPDEMGVGIAL